MSALKSSFFPNESNPLIFNLAPFPMWIYDLEAFGFLAVNREAVLHYGYSESEFLKMTLNDISLVKNATGLKRGVEVKSEKEGVFKDAALCRHRKKDGGIIYVHIKSSPIVYEGKKAEIVAAIDLTQHYEKEKELENQKKVLSVLGKLNEIFLKTENWSQALNQCFPVLGQYLRVQRFCFFEEGKSETAYPPATISWHVEGYSDRNPLNREVQRLIFDEFPHYHESILAGESIEILISSLPASKTKVFLKEQKIKSLMELPLMIGHSLFGILTIEDSQQERKWTEDENQLLNNLISSLTHAVNQDHIRWKLANSEARFRRLVQNGSDLIAIIDHKGNYKYVAPTSLNVLGIPSEEFIGRNAFEFIHHDDVPRILSDLEKLETRDKISIEPYRFYDAEKNWRWIQTDLANHIKDPIIAGIVANTREVTMEVEKGMSSQLLIALTKAISQPGSLATCLTDAMKKISEICCFSIVEMWMVAEDRSRLDLVSKSGIPASMECFYPEMLHFHTCERGEGLPGRVWELQETQILENFSANKIFLRREEAKKSGFQTVVGLPVEYNKEFLGCILCFSPLTKREVLPQIKLLSESSAQLAAVIKQKMTEEQYKSFFNISPDPHGLLGFDGYLKKVNNAFVKILGHDKRELLSKPVFQFLLKDDIPHARKRLNELIEGAPNDSFEARFVTKQGRIKWLVWRGSVIQESKIIVAAAKDITALKEVEIKLSRTNERLRRAHKIAKLGYWYRDIGKDKSEWSDEVYTIHGYTADDFVPTQENVKLTFHPEDRYLLESELTEYLGPGTFKSFEHRIITATNEVKWVHQEIRMLVDGKQQPYRMEGTIQDITERKENELQLAISNERFQLAINASNEMIWEVDHLKQTIFRGAGYTKLIKYKTNEPFLRDNSWCKKLPSSEMDKVWASLQAALADKKQNFWSTEYMINTESGSIAYFVDRCFILRDDNGIPIRSVGSALDVTNSRQQLERIKNQNEQLKEIAWLQSHVIRAPLSRIMGLIYLMKEYDGGGKSTEEIIDMISTSTEELDQVIQEIVNKTEAVKEDDSTNPVD